MENASSPEPNQSNAPPQPEALKPRVDDGSTITETTTSNTAPVPGEKKARRHTYRPSHKATFISFGVVALILAINAGVLTFILKKQNKLGDQAQGQVTISQDVLNKLGVNRSSVGDAGVGLTIGPNTQFKQNVDVAGDTTISGQLKINSKFSASDAALGQLESGKTSVSELDVNGSSTASSLSLRNGLLVKGSTQLQGTVTISKLLTVNNNLNVSGNLSIGGTFSAHSLASTSNLIIGGHIVTGGSSPSVSGSHLGSNGTISISGNDATGTVAVNLGTGGGGGIVATVTFHTQYANTPHVIITPIGNAGSFYIGSRSVNGFTIGLNSTFNFGAGLGFDYIVAQ